MGISMLAHWATSFCFSFASPYMIDNIGGNTFLVFMAFDIVATIFCFFLVKETRGKLLEVAAGTEWEVAEKTAIKSEPENGEWISAEPHILHGDGKDDGMLVDEATGKTLEVVGVHDTFWSNLKHRS